MGMRKNLTMFCFFSIVSRRRTKKKEGRKTSEKMGDTTAGRGDRQTSFHRSKLLNILGRVAGNCELTVADYIIPNEIAY